MDIKIDKERLQRTAPKNGDKPKRKEPPEITQGSVEKILDLIFNPSRDKIREVTIIDRIQGRLLPQLDIIDLMWQYSIEIAIYRQNPDNYKVLYKKDMPEPPDLINEFTYRTAQWQKSVLGKNFDRGVDLALAEKEAQAGMEDPYSGSDYFKES